MRTFSLLIFICWGLSNTSAQTASENIRLNQIGFFPESEKLAVVNSSLSTFEIVVDGNLASVYEGTLSEESYWNNSEEYVRIADFSDFKYTGTYRLKLGSEYSHAFVIQNDALKDLSKGSIKAYYFNRASTELTETYAGDHQRPLGHPDDEVVVHPSAASPSRPAGAIISTPKGWYDAGDYNKYIVNSGISMFTLLAAYENYSVYYDNLELNIPESGNEIPDLLDEVLWNLEWMLTMQDPEDGGVYNKTTTANFQGAVMPHQATATRYVVAKGTAATLDFAAVMAMTARIYKPFLPDLATECLEKAEFAWQWAQANPNVPFNNPDAQDGYPAVSTGGYGDSNFNDEFFWAAAELYITTGNLDYLDELNFSQGFDVPGWPNVGMLGILSLINHDIASASTENILLDKAEDLLSYQKNSSPYRIPINQFYWGSNSLAGNQGLILMAAFELTGETEYFNGALSAMDYLLGRNPTGYCYVTGFGDFSPMHIHHRQSEADDVIDPVPGFLAGGPNPNDMYDCGEDQYPSSIPAKSYYDSWCSYSTNEITINWNAPLVYLSGALQHIYETEMKGPDRGEPEIPLRVGHIPGPEIFPNPASETIQVKSNNPISKLSLISLSGAELLSTHQGFMDISCLADGVYLVKIYLKDQETVRKFMKR